MTIQYTPRGTCSRSFQIEVEDGVIRSVQVVGGCDGNLKGLSSLLADQGYSDFSTFVTQLLRERNPQQMELVLNRLTTNYTFFMREKEHFDFFTKVIMPELVHKYQKKKSIAIWSAGCSIGEEPYILTMRIKEFLGPQASQWDTRILATDISQKALAKAKKGVYEVPDTVPALWRKKY